MAKFIYHNENPQSDRINDCVTRAISFASDMDYADVRKKLWLTAELYECNRICRFCYENFITNTLQYKRVNCDGFTVEEFADTHPYGTYLIRVPSHLTVIRDGILYDIWDCRDEFCDIAWKRAD